MENHGKSHFLMGKSTISMAMFNSKLLNYQRVDHVFMFCFRPLPVENNERPQPATRLGSDILGNAPQHLWFRLLSNPIRIWQYAWAQQELISFPKTWCNFDYQPTPFHLSSVLFFFRWWLVRDSNYSIQIGDQNHSWHVNPALKQPGLNCHVPY